MVHDAEDEKNSVQLGEENPLILWHNVIQHVADETKR